MYKIAYREVIQNLSEALTEKNRQLAELKALNHDLSKQLALALAQQAPQGLELRQK